MLDRYTLPLLKRPLQASARVLAAHGVSANQVTVVGFVIGLLAVPALLLNAYGLALGLILLNRLGDGIDGELARLQGPSDAGAFLDITLDFIFYQAVVFGFALADPAFTHWALLLMLSFVGTGISFLAFAIMAERRSISNPKYPNKGLHYMAGLAEGTETIAFFVACSVWPAAFPWLAGGFAALCFITAGMRILFGFKTLQTA